MEAGSTRAEHSRLFGFLCCVLCFFVVLWFTTAPGGTKQTCTLKRDSETFEMEIGLAEALLVALREEISYSQKTQEQDTWKILAESVCGRQDFEALIGSAALTDPVCVGILCVFFFFFAKLFPYQHLITNQSTSTIYPYNTFSPLGCELMR